MAVPAFTGTGGLFTRLGKLFGLAKTIRTHQQAIAPTAATATSGVRAIYSVFASTTGTLPMATDMVRAITNEDVIADASIGTLASIKDAAERTLIETMDAAQNMPAKTLEDALRELAFQMNESGNTIARSNFTVGTPSYNAANTGNARILVSLVPPRLIKDNVILSSKLASLPCARAETLTFSCLVDAKSGSVAAGSEHWVVRGERSFPNLDRRWRAGSGAALTVTQTCASIDGYDDMMPGNNLLTNSDFELFTANVPDRWSVVTGTAGTHFRQNTTEVQRGSSSLEFMGDGTTKPELRQRFADASGTYGRLRPDTLYLLSIWTRRDSVAPASGSLRISIRNASGTGIGPSLTIDFTTGYTTSYSNVTSAATTNIDIPDEAYIEIEWLTALSNGRSVYIDELTLAEMPRLARGGPGVAIVAGSTDTRKGDLATVAISTDEVGEFNLELDRMFNLYESGVVLPQVAASSATISDTLIS